MEGISEDGNYRKIVFCVFCLPFSSLLIKYKTTLLCRSSLIPQKKEFTLENKVGRRVPFKAVHFKPASFKLQ